MSQQARARPGWQLAIAARALISDMFGHHGLSDAEVVRLARQQHGVDPSVVLSGLTCLDGAREALDIAELELMDAARSHGTQWQQIGAALGYAEQARKQGAVGRYRRLRHRYPGYTPARHQEAPDGRDDPPQPHRPHETGGTQAA